MLFSILQRLSIAEDVGEVCCGDFFGFLAAGWFGGSADAARTPPPLPFLEDAGVDAADDDAADEGDEGREGVRTGVSAAVGVLGIATSGVVGAAVPQGSGAVLADDDDDG